MNDDGDGISSDYELDGLNRVIKRPVDLLALDLSGGIGDIDGAINEGSNSCPRAPAGYGNLYAVLDLLICFRPCES
jgi:hypothetical protein